MEIYHMFIIYAGITTVMLAGEKQKCYTETCTKTNCLTDDINNETIIESTCRTDHGCFVKYTRTKSTVRWVADCANTPCDPRTELTFDGMHVSQCCNKYLCNYGLTGDAPCNCSQDLTIVFCSTYFYDDVLAEVKPGLSQCYLYHTICNNDIECFKEDIANNRSSSCNMNPTYGCYVEITRNGATASIKAGCASASATCSPVNDYNGTSRMCCQSDLCNNSKASKDTSADRGLVSFRHSWVLVIGTIYTVLYYI